MTCVCGGGGAVIDMFWCSPKVLPNRLMAVINATKVLQFIKASSLKKKKKKKKKKKNMVK